LAPYLNFCDGVFLEIGANDGYSQSNTYYLERWLGWSGILIEPLPDLFAYCRRIRPHSSCYNLACTASTAERFLSIEPSNLTTTVTRHMDSRTMGALRVTTAMLSEVIDDAGLGAPDFISIDVEGFELDVLHGLRLEDHTPLFMLVETDDPKGVERLLGTSMRFEAQLTYHDYLFRRVAS
jgi:FkbM family methyltransferase